MFSVDIFTAFLTANGFEFKDNGKSVILRVCPECGNSAWKVGFSQDLPESGDRVLGKCFKCDTGFSSVSYLLASEIDKAEVFDLHGIRKTADEKADLTLGKLETLGVQKSLVAAQETVFSLDEFTPMGDCLGSYHSKYAISRGVPPALYKDVMVDFKGGSVVFPVIENGKVAGYQKRLLFPGDPSRKAHTPSGFRKAEHILEYPCGGDILVVEGPFTAISGYVFGFHSICTFGAGVSGKQLDMIEKIALATGKRIAVGYDLDHAGLVGLYRIKNTMERRGIEVYRIMPEAGNDLNDAWAAGKGYKIESIEESVDTTVPLLGGLGD